MSEAKAPKSTLLRIIRAITRMLQDANLAGVPEGKVVARKLPRNRAAWTVGCFVTPIPETITQATNSQDDIGYGVQVALIQASNQVDIVDEDFDDFCLWRERARAVLLPTTDDPLPPVPEVHTLTFEPGAMLDPQAFEAQFDAQSFVVRCVVRENRQRAI